MLVQSDDAMRATRTPPEPAATALIDAKRDLNWGLEQITARFLCRHRHFGILSDSFLNPTKRSIK